MAGARMWDRPEGSIRSIPLVKGRVVGFTGTRHGMTERQRLQVQQLLRGAREAHHGDCVGSDSEFHDLCLEEGVPVVLHPPDNPRLRAFCEGAARVCPPKPYRQRNADIVGVAELMIGAPKEEVEPPPMRGQGTWMTIRMAKRLRVMTAVIWP